MISINNIKEKIVDLSHLDQLVSEWKKNQQRVVFTNGCFDILHRGHVEYLSQSADCGNKLIVAINSDSSVKGLDKGSTRPIQDEYSRALIIASLNFVDAVVIFNEQTPIKVINQLVPDVLIKGGDYDADCTDPTNKKYIVGSDVVIASGGRVKVIQFVPGFSTSKIEEKIKSSR